VVGVVAHRRHQGQLGPGGEQGADGRLLVRADLQDQMTARPQQRQVVDRFLAALRAGDFDGLLAVLDPDVVARVDGGGGRPGAPREVRGAQTWAKGALAFTQAARFVHPALVDGRPGLILVRGLRLLRALCFEIAGDKIVQVDVVTDPARLRALDVAVFGD